MKVRITDESLDEMVRAGLLPEEAAAELRSMWQANVATSTSGWAPIPDPATQPVVVHAYGGGGRASYDSDQEYADALNMRETMHAIGDAFAERMAEQSESYRTEELPKPIGISSRAGGVVTIVDEVLDCRQSLDMAIRRDKAAEAEAMRPNGRAMTFRERIDSLTYPEDQYRSLERKMASGPGVDPGPHRSPPEPTHCGCGASFATVKRIVTVSWSSRTDECGDCVMRHSDKTPLDARIRDAREGRDEDPTTWTAGATPGWEWP